MTSDRDLRPQLPDPASAPELFEGVLVRRVLAFIIDMVLIGIVTAILTLVGLIVGLLTLGLGWLVLPIVIPVVILGYYVVTLGSPMRATIGMNLMDLVLTPARGMPLDGWKILIHPLIFWITVWIAWPISLAVALLTPRREMVQDLIYRYADAEALADGAALAQPRRSGARYMTPAALP